MKTIITIISFITLTDFAYANGHEPIIGANQLLKKCQSYVNKNHKYYNETDASFCQGFFQGFIAGKFFQDRIDYEGICMPVIWEDELAKLYVEYTLSHPEDLFNNQGIEKGYTTYIIKALRENYPCLDRTK